MKLPYITLLLGFFVLAQAISRAQRGQAMPWEGDK